MTAHSTERRYTKGVVELREAPVGSDFPVIHGTALRFNKLSQNLGGFVERVNPSALRKTLADGGDVVCRMHHDDRYLLGRTSANTLRLNPTGEGLDYEADSPGTSWARDLEIQLRRRDVRHSSFAFRTVGDGGDDWSLTDNGFPLRTLLELQLIDTAPVVNPAYLDTSSSVRSLADRLDADPAEVAEMLRTGAIRKALQVAPTVVDLGGENFVPKTEPRKFNPRQPRGNDGKWSDLPGGGGGGLDDLLGDDAGPKFKADVTARAGSGKVGIASREDGGADLGLRYGDDPDVAVVSLSPGDVDDLDAHLTWVTGELSKQQKKADAWDDESAADPEHNKMRDAIDAKLAAAKKFPLGHPDRARLQAESFDLPQVPSNPHEKVLGESVASFGGLHFSAELTEAGPRVTMSDRRISADTSDTEALVMSPRQATTLVAKIKAITGAPERSLPTSGGERPSAPHLSSSARARELALLAKRAPL